MGKKLGVLLYWPHEGRVFFWGPFPGATLVALGHHSGNKLCAGGRYSSHFHHSGHKPYGQNSGSASIRARASIVSLKGHGFTLALKSTGTVLRSAKQRVPVA